jgi:hypothetical protein
MDFCEAFVDRLQYDIFIFLCATNALLGMA